MTSHKSDATTLAPSGQQRQGSSKASSARTVFLFSNSCIETRLDLLLCRSYFEATGWRFVDTPHHADLIVFNTCAVDQSYEDDSINTINDFLRNMNPSSELMVCGCLPSINKDRLGTVFRGRSFSARSVHMLNEYFNTTISFEDLRANILNRQLLGDGSSGSTAILSGKRAVIRAAEYLTNIDDRLGTDMTHHLRHIFAFWFNVHMYYIKVSSGCLGKCSFCAVRRSKGGLRSAPMCAILDQVRYGLDCGYKEFVLAGDDVGSYGRDNGTTLVHLLRAIMDVEGSFRLYIRYIEPEYLIKMLPDLKNLFRSRRILYFCSSVQSGNNRILGLMNRSYKIEEFKECIQEINREFPFMLLRTQVMVGFPGETEEEYSDTVRLFDDLNFNSVGVYKYSARPHTQAAAMPNQIPEHVKDRRRRKLTRRIFFRRCLASTKYMIKSFGHAD